MRRGRADALQATAAGDRAPLPRRAPVDDVRRQRPAHAGARGHQAATAVQSRLVARGRLARRVPGRRRRRRRLRRELQGPRLRARMRNGSVSGGTGRAAGRWRRRRRSSARTSSCTGWTGSCGCSTAAAATSAGTPDRFAHRVVPDRVRGLDYFGAWNGRVYALDLKRRRCAGSNAPARRSPRARRSREGRSSSATTAAACTRSRLAWGNGACPLRQRPRLPHAGRCDRPRLPPLVHRRLTDSVRDLRPLPALARQHRLVRLLFARGVVDGRVYFGSYNGRLYAVSAKSGRVQWTVGAGGPRSGAAVVVDGVAYAGSTWGRITGVDAKSGRIVLNFPHGEYVPVSGNGRRLLLHGYSRDLGGRADGVSGPSDSLRDVYERRGSSSTPFLQACPILIDRKFARVSAALASALPCESFLDAGCGDGRHLAALPSLGQVPTRVVGVDIAESILRTAAAATGSAGMEAELGAPTSRHFPSRTATSTSSCARR